MLLIIISLRAHFEFEVNSVESGILFDFLFKFLILKVSVGKSLMPNTLPKSLGKSVNVT